MAEIFLACERGVGGLERTVVIKQILPHLASKASFVDMFLREARIVARLSHPNVVQIYELGEEAGTYYIAMEYIHGSTVRELQLLGPKDTPVPLEVAAGVLSQACRGAHAAHELQDFEGNALGLVHRDISPHNLMVTEGGTVKLLDFGVAKGTEGTEETYSGSLKGKFAYMSPEQCRHHDLDRRSDVFALGIVAWELCTGEKLFKRGTELEMLKAITEEPIPAPSEYNRDVPMVLDMLILKALARERDDRFQTADELRRALDGLVMQLRWDASQDRIAQHVSDVAGDQLLERRAVLQEALERPLDSHERLTLLHATGSRSIAAFDEDPTTATKALAKSGAPRSDTGAPTRLEHSVPTGTGTEGGTATVMQAQPAPTRRSPVVAAIGTAVLVAAVGAAYWWGIQNRGAGEDPVVANEDAGDAGTADVEAIKLEGPPLRFGWAPTVDPAVLRKETAPLQAYLQRELKRPVKVVLADSYADLSKRLRANEVEFASMPPLLYTRTRLAEPKIDVMAIKEFDGAHRSDGYLLVPQASPITRLKQLEGKKFCLTNRNSTTGFFLPRHYLRSQGYEPDEFIAEIHWSNEHMQLLRDLIDGKCDAAATYSGAFLTGGDFGVAVGKLRLLAITGYTPQDAIVAAPGVTNKERDTFAKALLRFDPMRDAGVKSLGMSQRITGFAIPERERFDQLRTMVLAEDKAAAASKQQDGDGDAGSDAGAPDAP